MITNINQFLLLENIQQAKKYLKERGINPEDDTMFFIIKDLLKSTPNLIGHFVKLAHEEPHGDMGGSGVEEVIDWINRNRDKVGKLPKNVLEYQTIEELEDDIKDLGRKLLIKKFYKSLYGSMRDKIDKLLLEQRKRFDDLSLSFMELNDEVKKQFTPLKYFEANNISIEDFIQALENFIENQIVNQDKIAILEKLKKYKGRYKIKYDKNNVLVIQSNDKEVVCDLGSQNWCIVYSPDSYAKSYYGVDTNNTQYIIYNFNLPSSAENSMFGVTIEENGNAKYGGCQNKRNQGVSLDQIYELTGIPPGTLTPMEEIQKRKEDKEKILNFFKSDDINFEDISNFYKENNFEKVLFDNVLQNNHLLEVRSRKLFNETFNKPLNEVVELLKDSFIVDLVSKLYDNIKFIILATGLDIIDTIHYLILLKFNKVGKDHPDLIETLINSIIEQYKIKDIIMQLDDNEYQKLIDKFNVTEIFINNLYDKIGNKTIPKAKIWDYYKKFTDMVRDRIIYSVFSIVNTDYIDFDSFYQYKTLYDKYVLSNEEVPYETIFEEYDNVDMLAYLFYEDVEFSNFLIEQLNIKKEQDDIEIGNIIEKIVEGPTNDRNVDEYSLLDKQPYGDFLIEVIEKVEPNLTEIISKDDILGMFLYKNLSSKNYDKEFKKRINVDTDENGIDYVVVSDFTSFDDLIFKEEYFNMLEDFQHFDWYEVDDNTLENYFSDLDDYNIIYIANHILKESPEFKQLLSTELVNQYITESENMVVNDKKVKVPIKELQYKYESTEDLNKIKKILQEIIFDNEELDEDEYNKDFIEEDIKKEMIYRALMYALESVQYDFMWNSLIDSIGDYLGGNNWSKDDEAVPRISGNSIYKFKDNNLLFTIDVSILVEHVENYGDFYYIYGNEFNWENLVSYVAKELNSPINMEYEFEKASWESPNKKTYNEAFRNL